jgi:hypothetical protein
MFQGVEQVVSGIFSMANNKENKDDLQKVPHCHQLCGQPQNCVVFILTQTIVEDYI